MTDSSADPNASISSIEFEPLDLNEMTPAAAIETIINQAAEMNASDLYVMNAEKASGIRVRRMGRVELLAMVSHDQAKQIVSALKASAGMDIAERRRPTEGRLMVESGDQKYDLRISCVPTIFGEDMTCRILDRSVSLMELDDLGMGHNNSGEIYSMLGSSSGLVLVSGPTGCGKTTTLYACLQHLNNGARKINTLEDPVEYALSGVCQSQVNSKLQLDFPELLRNILRQTPDVIMVGEIRDEETAITAVRAANSGHLVLATVHAPVAAGAVQTLLALGVHPFFLASSLLGVVAQRLIRVLCAECKVAYEIGDGEAFAEVEDLLEGQKPTAFFGPGSCESCFGQGYSHRTGLFEVMSMNREVRRLITEARPSREIEAAAIENGMIEFRRAAMVKVAQGVTSMEELMRVVPNESLGLED
ncbi:MAG: GspE/PulE family protein [bacterium]|nr:GspE/PulE family protein [bacterium]